MIDSFPSDAQLTKHWLTEQLANLINLEKAIRGRASDLEDEMDTSNDWALFENAAQSLRDTIPHIENCVESEDFVVKDLI